MDNQNSKNETKKKKNGKKIIIIITIIILVIIAIATLLIFKYEDLFKNNKETISTESKNFSQYRIGSNSLEYFDLIFLQLENEKSNIIYSPLSIKYALGMLNEGTKEESKEQISNIIGDYKATKYINSKNISFANSIFIKDTYKSNIKEEYINILKAKYNSDVIYDSFTNVDNINNWVSNKTFNLIDNLFDKVDDKDFIFVNALAIDMEWKNKIQSEQNVYSVSYNHENFNAIVSPLSSSDYHSLDFNNNSQKVKSVEFTAVANKYDIVNEIGEENIRQTVKKEYEKWLADGACGSPQTEPDVDTYLNNYINEINANYKQISSSTDFYFYDDESVKAFAKDLKEYNGIALQYVGIMPKTDELDEYIKNIDTKKINTIISNLKSVELDNFKDDVITKITGYIPMFKFDYKLNLISDLKSIGITNVFDSKKANLSSLTNDKNAFIDSAVHKANIEFSNDGIKASAATAISGLGSVGCWFEYNYDVPVEEINLTFDKPFIFLIRDKTSNEIWFVGTVYEPLMWESGLKY